MSTEALRRGPRWKTALGLASLLLAAALPGCKGDPDKGAPRDDREHQKLAASPDQIFGGAVIEYWDVRKGITADANGGVTAWAGQIRGTTVSASSPTNPPKLAADGSYFSGQPVIQCNGGQHLGLKLDQPLVPSGTRPYFAVVGRLQSMKPDNTNGEELIAFDHDNPAMGDAGIHLRLNEVNQLAAYYRMGGLSPEVMTPVYTDTNQHIFEHGLHDDIGITLAVDGRLAAEWTQTTPWPLWYVRPALQAGLDMVNFCPVGDKGPGFSVAQVILLAAPPTDAQRASFLAAAQSDFGDPYCGDNVVNGLEQCDDGNDVDGDTCRNDCTVRTCPGAPGGACPPTCPNGQCGLATLDQVSVQPVAAYSVADRLRSLYLGPAFRVRRASDGAEADIGFGEQNHVDDAQVNSFCGGSDGYISVLYDQSGGGRDVPQTDPAQQIKLYDGASQQVTKYNGRPVLSIIENTRNLWRHRSIGVVGNPAVNVAYVGRFVSVGATGGGDVAPIRIGIDDNPSAEGNEIALSYAPGADWIYFGSGSMTWPNPNSTQLHRTLFSHAGGANIGTSSMWIEGNTVQPSDVSNADNATFHLVNETGLLIGKHPSNGSGATAELQTVIIYNQFLAGEDAATVAYSLQIGPDLCPQDPNKNAPGKCGCGVPEADTCTIVVGDDDKIIPRAPAASPIYDPAAPALLPGIEATFTETAPGDGYYSDLHLLPEDGQHEPQRFCDSNGNPIPTPSDEQLNASPSEGANCLGQVGDNSTCPIDPSSLTNKACSTDVDCDPGYICGTKCTDPECLVLEHWCGKHAASCGGLTPETNCEDYNICAPDGAAGTDADIEALKAMNESQLTQTDESTGQKIPDSEKTAVPDFEPVNQADACFISNDVAHLTDSSDKQNMQPKKKWDVFLNGSMDYGMSPKKNRDWVTELSDLHGSAKFAFGADVWGNRLEVLSGEATAALTDCGITLVGTAKLFGEAVVAISADTALNAGLTVDGSGRLTTPKENRDGCESAKKLAQDAQHAVRETNLFAREFIQYYKDNGLTPELCKSIVAQVPAAEKDSLGSPYNCDDLENLPASRRIDLIDYWKTQYDVKAAAYPDFSDKLGVARQQVEKHGTIDLFDLKHPYKLKIIDQDFPIGPITLNLAIEGYGSWDIKGGVQYGLGFSTNVTSDLKGVQDVLANGVPTIGDIRAFAGPVMTPELDAGIAAFVGVGIPGVSVGIEGNIDLVDAKLPLGAVAVAMRVSEDDRRDISQTDYAGTVKPGLANKVYTWNLGYTWNASLDLTELSGKLDLAARLHLLFFKKTFRINLFDWKGFNQKFILVGGGGGTALSYADTLGKQAETLAYTDIEPITDAVPKVAPMGPSPRVCDIAPD